MFCMCACPDMAKIDTMTEKDMCKDGLPDPDSPLTCFSTKSECSAMYEKELKGGSKADAEEGMNLMCKSVGLGCQEKYNDMMTKPTCNLEDWMTKGCDAAAM